jgi:1-deoxy-D-xylulose-5-phosphate reductoisomerase
MTTPRKVIILGSTGSIGTSAIKVAQQLPDQMQIVGLAAHSNSTLLLEQAHQLNIKNIALTLPNPNLPHLPNHSFFQGPSAMLDLVNACEADMLLVAVVGVAALAPTLRAIELGRDIAIASKEILVMAGETVMSLAKQKGVKMLPVDSEHNAIFQCLHDVPSQEIRRIILTASGGPFRKTPASEFNNITRSQALKHPTWTMGQKITIDSATLFNKGLEMIEARWLFDLPMNQIEVIVHPESIIHSMVEFNDHSVLAQLSHSDMCFPIQYAVTYPKRYPNQLKPLNFAELSSLNFEPPREQDFPALRLSRLAGETSGTLPAVLNAANEIAVEAFLNEQIKFPKIWQTVETIMEKHQLIQQPNLDQLIATDLWARHHTKILLDQA